MDLAALGRSGRDAQLLFYCIWLAVVVVTVVAYAPGLGGPFLLDDEPSISALGKFGGVTDWETFKAFVFGGTSGPTGRPLALLSFLVDGNTWPTDPWPFKRTNLVIHLLNGGLLGILTAQILRLLQYDKRDAFLLATIATACWLLHPFLVSTTLYAVQRMAQLSTLFVFAGLITYLHGRSMLAQSKAGAYLVMSASLVLFTLLSTFSKESGALLPLLAGIVDFTVVGAQGARYPVLDKRWLAVFIIAPALLIIGYLVSGTVRNEFFEVVPPRDFSIYERLLTQPRVLFDYIQNWFVPSLYTTGVFQDHFLKSTGLLSPLTTLLSLVFHAALISAAVIWRRTWPLLSLAVLFYYGSHLLESTVLNLDMYFEHRNYVASAFLFLPLIEILYRKINRQVFFVMAVGAVLVLGGFTRYSATVWQNFSSMVEASAKKAPTSARAQAQYAVNLFNAQYFEEALQTLDNAIETIPGDKPLLLVNRLIMQCNLGLLDDALLVPTTSVLSRAYYDVRSMNLYATLVSAVASDRCPGTSMEVLREMFDAMASVPLNSDPASLRFAQIRYLSGVASSILGDPVAALDSFRESLQADPNVQSAMTMARVMATQGHFVEALELSDMAIVILYESPATGAASRQATEEVIRTFQKIVRGDIEASPGADE